MSEKSLAKDIAENRDVCPSRVDILHLDQQVSWGGGGWPSRHSYCELAFPIVWPTI